MLQGAIDYAFKNWEVQDGSWISGAHYEMDRGQNTIYQYDIHS